MARILIADRVPFMSNITKFALQYGGHDVVGVAENGEQALDYYLSLQPDLLISEIILPKMNGIEVLAKIKKIYPNSKILMCSTVRKGSVIEKAISHGAQGYIIKPFQINSFLSEVRRIIGVENISKESIPKQIISQEVIDEMLGKILTRSITPDEIGKFLKGLKDNMDDFSE
jgi:two-component system, chemotaxis family, chemotaxis protein CheY